MMRLMTDVGQRKCVRVGGQCYRHALVRGRRQESNKMSQRVFYDPPLFRRVSLMWGNSVCFTSSNLMHSIMNTKHEKMDVQK